MTNKICKMCKSETDDLNEFQMVDSDHLDITLMICSECYEELKEDE